MMNEIQQSYPKHSYGRRSDEESCEGSMENGGEAMSRPQSQTDSVSNSYTYRTRNQKLVCQDIKIKRQKEAALLQGDGPDFGGPFTRMYATPRPGEARRARACGFPFLFSQPT